MNDHPYTTADEDPFNVQPIVLNHRRSALLDKWIMDQQKPTKQHDTLHLPKPSNASVSFTNPYLAYPDLPRVKSLDITETDDGASIISYDLVDDSDIPANVVPHDPSIPLPVRTTKNLRHSLAPAFRNINLPFLSPTSSNTDASSSRTFSRLSIFQRTPRSSIGISSNNDLHDHNKSSSISTHHRSISQQSANSNLNLYSPRATSRWRPSVLGHFYHPSASQSSVIVSESPSRPSISSADTSSTSQTATTVESNLLSTPPKINHINSTGSRKTLLSPFPTASGSSIRLPGHGLDSSSRGTHCQMLSQHQTTFTPELGGNVDDDDDIDPLPTFCAGHHDTIRSSIPYSSGSLSRVKFSSLSTRSQRKKKKLVISGIGVGEVRKFEGIKRWCESFGEVRQITRVPNGDLHIDFRDSEVADTVCRVRAKVHIAGVGSVQLSWFAGHKR